jgi:hypothetical protein
MTYQEWQKHYGDVIALSILDLLYPFRLFHFWNGYLTLSNCSILSISVVGNLQL